MITATCTRPGYNNSTQEYYESGKTYSVDENDPYAWRHFKFPEDVDMPGQVRDALGIDKDEAEDLRGEAAVDGQGRPRKGKGPKTQVVV
jgi:hypothetical protein